MKHKIAFFLLIFFVSACDTGSKYVGRYFICECEYLNGDSCIEDGYMDLQNHHKFSLVIFNKSLKGTWRYYDNNDASIIELSSNGFNYSFECVIGEDGSSHYLDILNPHVLLGIDTLKTLQLKTRL